MSVKDQVFSQDQEHYLAVFQRYPIVLSHGKGAYLYDTEGKQYLDFLAGIAVNVVGHGHEGLVQAISDQAGKLIHCSNLYYTEVQAEVAQKLAEKSGLDRVFLANSGAEANEGAIKLARKYGKKFNENKYEIITAEHSFHGRTYATLTATGQPKYHKGFEPMLPGFSYVPYNDIAALEKAVSERTCAIMLEPIQGEGGVHVPDQAYLQKARELCDKYGALLIFDEIQTGMGRTGKLFAYQALGVEPDVVTLAKGLGGGVPIGAFLTKNQVAEAFQPGDHGSTFGGNPLACAAAKAVLKALDEEHLIENAEQQGEFFKAGLTKLKEKYPQLIQDVRGMGLILGAELTRPGREIVEDCLKEGIIINCTAGNVLRFVPPLIVTKEQIQEVLNKLDQVLAHF